MAMKRKNLPELVPQVFEHEQFGSVRVVTIDGKPFFVGIDVAHALGYKNPQKALRDHVDDEDKRGERIVHPLGGAQKTILINKSGVYSLILDSQLPKAKEFRHWVTSEVLVKIDETGSYSMPQYDFFHPSPEELERRSKITTIEGMIEDLNAHGIDWDWEPRPRIKIDENGDEHIVYRYEVVIKHPEYEKLQKQRIEAKKSAVFCRNDIFLACVFACKIWCVTIRILFLNSGGSVK